MIAPIAPEHRPLPVLLVEDHDDSLETFSVLLKRRGHFVLPARSFEEALSVLHAHTPSILVSDILLSKESGIDLLKVLRARIPSIPALAISASATDDDARRVLDAGFDAFLAKPMDIDDFCRTIDELLTKSQALKGTTCGPDHPFAPTPSS